MERTASQKCTNTQEPHCLSQHRLFESVLLGQVSVLAQWYSMMSELLTVFSIFTLARSMARFTDLPTELHLMILNILRDHDKATGIRSDRNFRRHVLGLDLEDTAMSVYEREPFVRVVVGIAGKLVSSRKRTA